MSTSASRSTHSTTDPNARIRKFDDGGPSDRDEKAGGEELRAVHSPLKNGKRITRNVRYHIPLGVPFS
jgi:hypothetical protein